MNLIINTDGASRGNPGPASYGFVIKQSDGPILHQEGKTIGRATNNIAEYTAVLSSLEYVKKHIKDNKPHKIEVITDSQLIARQLDGSFKIKNENLKEIYFKIKSLELEIGYVFYRNVPREQNFIADRLANKALDEA
jgi:ribonuclease HI